MKRIKRIILSIGLMLVCLIPMKVNAANLAVAASSTKVKPGTTVTFTIQMNGSGSFGASQFIVKYDSSKFSYVSDRALQGTAVNSVTNGQVNVSLSNPAGMSDGNIYEVVLRSSSSATSGTSQVSVTAVDCWDPTGVSEIQLTGGSSIITHYQPSTINTLKSLSVSGCNLSPSFNADETSYKCSETDAASVTIDAAATDGSASVTGTGKKNLNFGSNKLNVVVTSESGVKKTYTVTITRKDNRSNENGLKTLTISNTDFVFDEAQTDFTVNVGTDVTSVDIAATAKDEKSKVSGTGTFELQEGENSFSIQVVAENGISKVYTVNIIRKPKDNVPSTALTMLIVEGNSLKINGLTYLVGAASNKDQIEIKCETDSKTSTFRVDGNENLVSGINIITITVSDEGVDDTVYTLYVYKEAGNLKLVTNLNEIKELTEDLVYKNKRGSMIIPSSFINLIKNSSNNLVIMGLNEYNGLLYEVTLNSNINYDGDLELLLTKTSNSPLSYSSTVPAGLKINLFIENTNVKYLYGFDFSTNTYKLISDDLTIKDNYVEFDSDGSAIYIFSDKPISNNKTVESKTGAKEWFTRIQYLLVGVFLGAIAMFFLKDKLIKKDKTITPNVERL